MSTERVQRVVEAIVAGCLVSVAAFFAYADSPTSADWLSAAFFTGMGMLVMILSYPVGKATSGSIGFLPFLSVALVAPNGAALVAVATSTFVGEVIIRRAWLKVAFNTAQQTFAVAVGLFLYLSFGGKSVAVESPQVVPFLGLCTAYFALNKLAVSTVVSASSGTNTLRHWMKSVQNSGLYDALSLPLIVLLALMYVTKGAFWTALAALPMLGIRQLYRMVFALEKVNEELLQLMVASIEARDPYTSGHSQRVARYAREVARAAGLPDRQVERVEIAALLHDVGKIHEEFATILRKPGRLSDEEFGLMKLHPIRSAELVAKVSHFSDLVSPVRAHHEAWDGSGYPDQLTGESIPLSARIIALADTIDAMTTSRPYRAGFSLDSVRSELERESGRQFDPQMCSKLIAPAAWTSLERAVLAAQREYPESEASESYSADSSASNLFVELQR
jgi:HD superfamily phosphohydrolase YqeK